ncbi:MAG: SPFH domain-containing protein [Patescibacteria group bacterium]
MVAHYKQATGHQEADLWDIVEATDDFPEPAKSRLEKWFGIRWYGLPPFRKILSYSFKWTAPVHNEGESKMRPSTETLSHIFVKETLYADKVRQAETSEALPMDVEYRVLLRVKNPYKALFQVHRWLDATLDVVGSAIREYISGKKYEDLLETSDKIFSEEVLKNIPEITNTRYGVEVLNLRLTDISPASAQAEEYRLASTKKYVEERAGEAAEARAKGESEAIKLMGDGEAKAIKAKGQAQAEAWQAQVSQAGPPLAGALNQLVEGITKAIISVRKGGE